MPARARREQAITVGTDALEAPLHWHVRIEWYTGLAPDGTLAWATQYLVFTNDVDLAIAYTRRAARALSGPQRTQYHVSYQEMCELEAHASLIPDELKKKPEAA